MEATAYPVFAREFIDRELERAFFLQRWFDARESRSALVLVEGDAGFGKSRLLAEIKSAVSADGGFIAEGASLPYAAASFAPIAEIIRTIVMAHPQAAPPMPYLRTVLHTIVPEIAPPYEPVAADNPLARRWLLDAIAETFNRLSATTPAFIVLEDIHWADPDSLAALSYLLDRIADLRVLIATTYRGETISQAPALQSFLLTAQRSKIVNKISLAELDETNSRALVGSATPRGLQLAPTAIARICNLAAGNPLYLEELVKHSLDKRDHAATPASIETLLRERLAEFTPEEARVLAVGAAIGAGFTHDELTHFSARSERDVAIVLQKAQRTNILVADAAFPLEYSFRHHLMRRVAYRALEPGAAAFIHAEVAAQLERDGSDNVEELAYHWQRAGNVARAVFFGEAAGDAAAARNAYERAIEAYEAVLPHVSGPDDRLRLERKTARMYQLLGSIDSAIQHYEVAVGMLEAQGGDELSQMRLTLSALRGRDWSERSIDDAFAALAAVDGAAANPWGFAAHVRLAEAFFLRDELQASRDHLNAAEPYVALAQPRHAALFRQVRSWLAFFDGDPNCIALALAAVADAAERNDPDNLVAMAVNTAVMASERGEAESAQRQFRLAIETGERYRLSAMQKYSQLMHAEFVAEYGSFADAARLLREATPAPASVRWLNAAAAPIAMRVAFATGDEELLAAWSSEELLSVSRSSKEAARIGPHAAAHAQLAYRAGAPEAGAALLREAVEGMRNGMSNLRTLLAVAQVGLAHELPRARELLSQTALAWKAARPAAYLLLYDALAAEGDGKRVGNARQAAELFEGLGIRSLAAASYELLGARAEALELYRQAGALAEVDRLEGLQPHAPPLSRRESEIVDCVSAGLTNKEIALRLGLSSRTVEHHVASILKKLALRSRTQIAAQAAKGKAN